MEQIETWSVFLEGVVSVVTLVLLLWHVTRKGGEHNQLDEWKFEAVRREVHWLKGKMSEFEISQHGIITRIDSQSFANVERQKEVHNMMTELIKSNSAQLEGIQKYRTEAEKVARELRFIRERVSGLPCVSNERENGGESCPAGEPIEGAGKMQESGEEG